MKILLTGATGFLGSHLARKWVNLGYEVILLLRSTSDFQRIIGIMNQTYVYYVDQVSMEKPFIDHSNIDIVVHAATNYGRNTTRWFEVYETNLGFALTLLKTAILFNVDTFFNTDTILYRYLNYYALSKNQFVEWGKMLSEKKLIQFVNFRLQHMYGFGDDPDKFTTYVIQRCLRNDRELLLTQGEQKRDFIYVDDVVEAYQSVVEVREQLSQMHYNYEVGTGIPTSIREFVTLVKYLTGSSIELQFGALPYRENEPMLAVADNTKLRALGWVPKVLISDGIRSIIKRG